MLPTNNQVYPQPQYPQQGAPQYPPQGTAQYPQQGAYQYPPQGTPQYPPQGTPQYPQQGAPQYPPQGYQQQPVMYTPGGQPMPYNPVPGYGVAPVIIQQVVQWPAKKSGFETLAAQGGILVKQKIEWLEVVSGCETENKYTVYARGKEKKGAELFKCKEKSDWFARNCLSGSCRPFEMNISTVTRTPNSDEHSPFLLLERLCQCTCWCINRPEVKVTLVEDGKNEYLGKIVDPFTCCNLQLDIVDHTDNVKYKAEGSCCQLGIWCKAPCEPCQTIDFEVMTAGGEKVGFLQKQSKGCLESAVSDADNFALDFPPNASDVDKALLLAAVLFLDFRHFEDKGGNQNNNNRLY